MTLILSCAPKVLEARQLDRADLARVFREIIASHSPWEVDDLVVEDFSSRPERFFMPEGSRLLPADRVRAEPGRRTLMLRVEAEGKEIATIRMSGIVRVFGKVLCAARPLPRNRLLTADDLTLARKELSLLGPRIVTDVERAIGRRLKVALPAGGVILSPMLKEPLLVKRGDRVTIVANTSHVRVTAPGEARASGEAGKLIRVKNLMSRKVVLARVVDKGLVAAEM